MPPPWLIVLIWTAVETASHKSNQPLDIVTRVGKHGYVVTEHTLKTDDGYLLTLFRVKRPGKDIGPPVLLMHGLLQNAAIWLDAGPTAALGYLLPKAGHDLWIGNTRGTKFSRQHAWLQPDSDPQYWQFSNDEIGRYDLPAIVDFVLSFTRSEKLNYIGFSQGAGTFFIMCSERPDYCSKVNLLIALAPSTRHLHTKSVLFRSVTQYFNDKEAMLKTNGIWEAFPSDGFVNTFLRYFCSLSRATLRVCKALKVALDGRNPGSISRATFKAAIEDFPVGTSVHNMAKYGQMMTCENFQKFDYGFVENLKMYGSEYPPKFNLSAVTVPTVVIYGRNDGIVDVRDVKWATERLPNVIESVEVKHRFWTHLDMNLSRLIPKVLYPKIIEYLNKFS